MGGRVTEVRCSPFVVVEREEYERLNEALMRRNNEFCEVQSMCWRQVRELQRESRKCAVLIGWLGIATLFALAGWALFLFQ